MRTQVIPSRNRLALIAFTSGAVVMSMELAGSRLVAPFLGSSLFVWTSLIGVILAFLSLGYFLGGRMADENPHLLVKILIFASAFLSLVAAIEYPVLILLSQFNLDVRLGAVLAATGLFAIPSILLGAVTPFAARLSITQVSNSGATLGLLYAVSTLGSIFGTFFTGFYLFSVLGSSTLLLALATVVACLALLANPRQAFGPFILLLLLQLGVYLFQSSALAQAEARGLRVRETGYHRVLILDEKQKDGRVRRLLVTDPFGAQSATWVDAPSELTGDYSQYYDIGVIQTNPQGKFLMLGGGAYSYPKYFAKRFPDATLDVVEIDPELQSIAVRYFGLEPASNIEITHADARIFLRKTSETYDALLIDVFNSAPEVPFHVTTKEFFALSKTRLAPEGLLLLNVIAAAKGSGADFLTPLLRTIQSEFPKVHTFLVREPNSPELVQNILVVASTSKEIDWKSLPPNLSSLAKAEFFRSDMQDDADKLIFTDDFAPVEPLMGGVYKALRQQRSASVKSPNEE